MIELFQICMIALVLGILFLIAAAITELHSCVKRFFLKRRIKLIKKGNDCS